MGDLSGYDDGQLLWLNHGPLWFNHNHHGLIVVQLGSSFFIRFISNKTYISIITNKKGLWETPRLWDKILNVSGPPCKNRSNYW